MAAQHFFVDGRYLGSREIPSYRKSPGLEVRWHHSYAIYCQFCGEIWGRFVHDKAPMTQFVNRNCIKHGDGRLSNLHYHQEDPHNFEPDWPDAAVAHEFRAWMALLAKEA